MEINLAQNIALIVLEEVEGMPEQLQVLGRLSWIIDILILLLLVFFIRSLYRKYKEVNQYLWEEEPTGTAKSSWRPLLANSGSAVLLMVLIPLFLDLSWKQMADWQPYLVYLVLLMLLLSFFSGIFLAYVRFAHRLKLQYKEKTTAE